MPPPPPPGGGSAIKATEPKPNRTAKMRINLLIKEFSGVVGDTGDDGVFGVPGVIPDQWPFTGWPS